VKLGVSLADIEDAPAVALDWLLEIDSTVLRVRNDKSEAARK